MQQRTAGRCDETEWQDHSGRKHGRLRQQENRDDDELQQRRRQHKRGEPNIDAVGRFDPIGPFYSRWGLGDFYHHSPYVDFFRRRDGQRVVCCCNSPGPVNDGIRDGLARSNIPPRLFDLGRTTW
jgi:hypothetical protein